MSKPKSKVVLTLVALLAITLFIISPRVCINATSRGINVWLVNVVPALFPFFILTRIVIMLNQKSIPVLDRFTSKCFNTSNAGLTYFLSMLSGYPIGAKLISSYYENGAIDKTTATKMFSFCSTSGPMFIIGTIGIGVFGDARIGYIILIAHIIGAFINGLIYRGEKEKCLQIISTNTNINLNEIMFDSINSILLVGSYIVFSSVIIELLSLTNVLPTIANFICAITSFNYDIIYSFLCGIIEITNGLIMLGGINFDIKIKIILASIIIAFSGICIMLQSLGFLNKIGIKTHTIIKQKITQTIITSIITFLIVLLLY